MIVALLVVGALLAVLVLCGGTHGLWRRRRPAAGRPEMVSSQRSHPSPAHLPAVTVASKIKIEREERSVTAAFLSGELPAARYRQRMAELAAQDAKRKPMHIPSDPGSG